jgi:hypothetical protein
MVKRSSKIRRRGFTAYKVVELLTGRITYPAMYYDGYGDGAGPDGYNDFAEKYIDEEMRQDWAENREALTAFWRSGKYTTTEELAEFGLDIRMPPWLFVQRSQCGAVTFCRRVPF